VHIKFDNAQTPPSDPALDYDDDFSPGENSAHIFDALQRNGQGGFEEEAKKKKKKSKKSKKKNS